jgi:hypothetical protein
MIVERLEPPANRYGVRLIREDGDDGGGGGGGGETAHQLEQQLLPGMFGAPGS